MEAEEEGGAPGSGSTRGCGCSRRGRVVVKENYYGWVFGATQGVVCSRRAYVVGRNYSVSRRPYGAQRFVMAATAAPGSDSCAKAKHLAPGTQTEPRRLRHSNNHSHHHIHTLVCLPHYTLPLTTPIWSSRIYPALFPSPLIAYTTITNYHRRLIAPRHSRQHVGRQDAAGPTTRRLQIRTVQARAVR